jgi:hypothetical protein
MIITAVFPEFSQVESLSTLFTDFSVFFTPGERSQEKGSHSTPRDKEGPEAQVNELLISPPPSALIILLSVQVGSRVARWYISKPKLPNLGKFGGPWNGKSCYVLWPFGIHYIWPFGTLCSN